MKFSLKDVLRECKKRGIRFANPYDNYGNFVFDIFANRLIAIEKELKDRRAFRKYKVSKDVQDKMMAQMKKITSEFAKLYDIAKRVK